MAKQRGPHPFVGKMGATIGYKLNDEYLERENGSKEGKSFKRDPRRQRTMYYAGLFKQASKAMQAFYNNLPKEQRGHGVFGQLTGKAFSLLKQGKTIEAVKEEMRRLTITEGRPVDGVKDRPSRMVLQSGKTVINSKATTAVQHYVVATIVRPYFCSVTG